MADDPEKDKDLNALENQGFTMATVEYEDFVSRREREHRAYWRRLADPWHNRRFDHRLDFAWYKPPFVGAGGKDVFPVEAEPVPSGSGKFQLKWTIWAKSKDLNTLQMEHYAVMRAEEYYIADGYTKIASKYFSPTSGPKPIPSENFGIDSFFRKEDRKYVACESKFTTDEGTFNDWQARKTRDDVRSFLRQRLSKKGSVRQMTWPWIKDRIRRAMQRPPTQLPKRTPAQKEAVRNEIEEMHEASLEGNIKRSVNLYGAKSVPIYPGRYKFRCGERGVLSKHILHLTWDLKVKDAEFMNLAHDFDEWIGP